MSSAIKLGIQPLTYGLSWPEALGRSPGRRRPRVRLSVGSRPPVFDRWRPVPTVLRGLDDAGRVGRATRRVRLGLLVGANPFRNPGIVAKMAATVDHISGGRLVFGLGAGNRELEVTAHGMEPGRSVGERLDWLDEALAIVRGAARRGDGASRIGPLPVQRSTPRARCPSRRMSRSSSDRPARRRACASSPATPTSGRCGSPWTTSSASDTSARSSTSTAAAIGRDPATIEHTIGGKLVIRRDGGRGAARLRRADAGPRLAGGGPRRRWPGPARSEEIARALLAYRRVGVDAFSPSVAAPLDLETIERLATEVRPMLDRPREPGHGSGPPLAGPIVCVAAARYWAAASTLVLS